MDHLRESIHALQEEEIKEFKTFINRQRKKKERRDLDLFEILREETEYTREELLGLLYPEGIKNLDAYHATRKRLIKEIHEFIHIRQMRQDPTMDAKLASGLSLTKFLLQQKREESAWHFFRKTEEMGQKANDHHLLNKLYSLGIEYSLSERAVPIEELIEKKQECQRLLAVEENAKTANYLIRHRLNKSLEQGKELDLDKLVRETLQAYNLTEEVEKDLKLQFHLIEISRSVALARKDFHSFLPYILEVYRKLEEDNRFNAYNHHLKVRLLYIMAHTLFRSRKFKDAETFANLLWDALQAHGKRYYKEYYQKWNLLMAVIKSYLGKVDECVELLEKSLEQKEAFLNKPDLYNTYVHLSINYFYRHEYEKALVNGMKLDESDAHYAKLMGKEWLMKKQLLEILNHFELGNPDVVETRIRSLERTYKNLFERPLYKRIKTFLSIIKRLNNRPHIAHTDEFIKLVEGSMEYWEAEDLQAMTFYCWLKAKMYNKPYYELLVDEVNALQAV